MGFTDLSRSGDNNINPMSDKNIGYFHNSNESFYGGLKEMDLPKGVKKSILTKSSEDDVPVYTPGTKVKFHYTVTRGDNMSVVETSANVGIPLELVLGKKFKLEIWEMLIRTMKVGETAEFKVSKQHNEQLPHVLQLLRKAFNPKLEDPHAHRCCGMIQNGLGHADLNDLLGTPIRMIYRFELLEVLPPGFYKEEAWQQTNEEKLNSLDGLREEGNQLFAQKEYLKAAIVYSDACQRAQHVLLQEKPGTPEHAEMQMKQVPFLLNYSLCQIKMTNYYEAKTHLESVLKIDPDNIKALYRRAECLMETGSFSEARKDYEKVCELDPTTKAKVYSQIAKLREMERMKDEQDKKTFSQMFAAMKT